MADRTAKGLLFLIALGLWLNLVAQWVRPAAIEAADADTTMIMRDLHAIATGACDNKKIC